MQSMQSKESLHVNDTASGFLMALESRFAQPEETFVEIDLDNELLECIRITFRQKAAE